MGRNVENWQSPIRRNFPMSGCLVSVRAHSIYNPDGSSISSYADVLNASA